MEIRRGVHALVQIVLLNIRVSIDVNNPDVFSRLRGNTSHGWKPDAMIATQNNRHCARTRDVTYAVGNLIERLFDVRRNGKYIPSIA